MNNDLSTPFARRTLGVLGGMGPLATVDFLGKIVALTPARRDQDHLPMLVRFCPEVPDRTAALCGGGPSPLPGLVAAARALEASGADCLAMPCNTAHAWHAQVQRSVAIPVLHIVDATVQKLGSLAYSGPVGLLATNGTLASGIYPSRAGHSVGWLTPDAEMQEFSVMRGIRAVKAGDVAEGARLLRDAAQALIDRGAASIVMACTEIPIAMSGQSAGVPLVDPGTALAKACLAWCSAARAAPPLHLEQSLTER